METSMKKIKPAPPDLQPGDGAERRVALGVTPKRAGFRRAGIAFPAGETILALHELTEAQREQLITDPMLVTRRVDLPAEGEDKP